MSWRTFSKAMCSGQGCVLGHGEGLRRAALVWVISHRQPAAL